MFYICFVIFDMIISFSLSRNSHVFFIIIIKIYKNWRLPKSETFNIKLEKWIFRRINNNNKNAKLIWCEFLFFCFHHFYFYHQLIKSRFIRKNNHILMNFPGWLFCIFFKKWVFHFFSTTCSLIIHNMHITHIHIFIERAKG